MKRRAARSWGSKRMVLKQHLEGQWLRGQGSPYDRAVKVSRYKHKGRPREYRDEGEPPTLGDVWPQ